MRRPNLRDLNKRFALKTYLNIGNTVQYKYQCGPLTQIRTQYFVKQDFVKSELDRTSTFTLDRIGVQLMKLN